MVKSNFTAATFVARTPFAAVSVARVADWTFAAKKNPNAKYHKKTGHERFFH